MNNSKKVWDRSFKLSLSKSINNMTMMRILPLIMTILYANHMTEAKPKMNLMKKWEEPSKNPKVLAE